MKNLNLVFAAIIACSQLFFTNVNAQSNDETQQLPKIGIGIHGEQYKIADALSNYYSAYSTSFLVPVNLTQHFRLEPEFGLLWLDIDDGDQIYSGFSSGLGAFYMFQRGKVNFYTGLRTKFDLGSMEGSYSINDQKVIEKFNSVKLAPTIGFEYFFSRNFSFGAEVGLSYKTTKSKFDLSNLDDATIEDHDLDEELSTSKFGGFESGLFLRAYF